MKLRDYQLRAVDKTFEQWHGGMRKTLLVMPTGTGKTICFGEVARRSVTENGRTLILAHREELINQAADKVSSVSGTRCGIEKAEKTSDGESIIVGSIQSLTNESRLSRISDTVTHIVIDEAHHALADSYQKVLGAMPHANVLGVTATPDRSDKANLGKYFDSVAFEYFMTDAVRDGHLCRIAAKQIPLELDLTGVKSHHGDYDANGTADALEPLLGQIADVMAKECSNRKTVVFLPLVSTSQKFTQLLLDRGMKAEEVNGKSENRADIIERFDAASAGSVLCNSMLLTEGWDCPSVDCVVVLRPTKSRALYTQMVGRGTRPNKGKENLLLLDFLWLTQDHRLVKPAHLVSKSDDIASKMSERLTAGEQLDLLELEKSSENDVINERENALAQRLKEQRAKKSKLVDPLQYAISIECADLADWVPSFAWEMEPPTERQIEAIEKFGVSSVDVGCKGMAAQILDRLSTRSKMGLATPKQIRCLESKGFVRVGTWSKEDASSMIGRISSNRWMVPSGINASEYIPKSMHKSVS